MRRQNRAALGYGCEHTHSILSMALREFSNEMRLYGACKWDPWTEIVLPAFIASTRASDIACARVDDGSVHDVAPASAAKARTMHPMTRRNIINRI